MKQTIFRIALAALTLSLLSIPIAAGAQDASGQTDSHQIKFLEDNLWDHDEVEQIAHYEIYIDRETNLSNEIRFIEENVADYNYEYIIDVFFPAQPAWDVDLTKPENVSESNWIRFVEDNLWDSGADAKLAQTDQLKAHTALCQGEDLMVPLERAFDNYADDVHDYCRNAGLADYAGAQGEGYVESVNQTLNPY